MTTCIVISGEDRVGFLQGQLTQDIERLTATSSLGTAWCNAKGRVFVTGQLIERGESIGWVVPADIADAVLERLTMYRLRAKVDLEIDAAAMPDDLLSPAERVAAGQVTISAANSEQFTPHMLNLDLTDSVSFTKGCYIGQEIVARTENLGKVKRRVNRYRVEDAQAAIGDKLALEDKSVGEIVNVAGDEILAVVPADQHGETLAIGAGSATPLPVPYSF